LVRLGLAPYIVNPPNGKVHMKDCTPNNFGTYYNKDSFAFTTDNITILNTIYIVGSYIHPSYFHPFQQFFIHMDKLYSFFIHCSSNLPTLYNVEKIVWPTVYAVFSVVTAPGTSSVLLLGELWSLIPGQNPEFLDPTDSRIVNTSSKSRDD
jgi:hypothetical protein